MSAPNWLEVGEKLVPFVVIIAKEILNRLRPEQRSPEIDAAIALFNAVLTYIEATT